MNKEPLVTDCYSSPDHCLNEDEIDAVMRQNRVLEKQLQNMVNVRDVVNLIMSERRIVTTIHEREMLYRLAKAVEGLSK